MKKGLQEQFISQLQIEGLKKTGSTKFNCRCPICGDSKRNKLKKRGWFLWNPKFDTYVYNCFNCDYVSNFQGIAKLINPSVFEVYKQKEQEENLNDFIKYKPKNKKTLEDIDTSDVYLEMLPKGCIPCSDNKNCSEYLEKRKVPKRFFNKWKYHKGYGLVVPFEYDKDFVYGWQGRRLDKKLFRTSLPENNPKIWNWFNINKSIKTFITESIIDASMLYHINEQSIAAVGADIKPEYVKELKEPIFIFDNDETGKRKTLKYSKLFPNAKFLYWDKRIKQKDLNEIIVSGISKDKFKKFINSSIMDGFDIQIKIELETI